MKTIFNEDHALSDFVEYRIEPRGEWNPVTRQYTPLVERWDRTGFCAYVRAHYDRATGALVVELMTTLGDYRSWAPAKRTVLELHGTREAALRRVIQVADDWYREVEAAIPPVRSDEELLAEYRAQQPAELVPAF